MAQASRALHSSPTPLSALCPAWPMAEPAWLTTRDGHPYCLVCCRFAVCNHLLSQGHRDRLGRFLRRPWDLEESEFPWPELGEPTPPGWGDAVLFVYHSRAERWFCRVCWAYVDASHLASRRHQLRSADGGRMWLDRGDVDTDQQGDEGAREDLAPTAEPALGSGRPWGPGGGADQAML